MIEKDVPIEMAKARTEIASARAFGMEPTNWAKKDIAEYVEKTRIFITERDEVDRRLGVAQEHSRQALMDTIGTKDFDPGKNAAIYWFEDARKREPNNPYVIAIEEERKIAAERAQLYKRFSKITPEQRGAEKIGLLLVSVMLGAAGEGAALTGEAEAAAASLGEAEAALAAGESEAALSSVMQARAILIAAEEAEAALVAVEGAKTALSVGEVGRATTAVAEARSALSATLRANPAAALTLATLSKAEARLDSAEKLDIDLGIAEKAKIDYFDYSEAHQDDVTDFLAGDLKVANEFSFQYRALVDKGEITPLRGGDRVTRKGCRQ